MCGSCRPQAAGGRHVAVLLLVLLALRTIEARTSGTRLPVIISLGRTLQPPEDPAAARRAAQEAASAPLCQSTASTSGAVTLWGLDYIDRGSVPGSANDGRYCYAATGAGQALYVVDTGMLLTHDEFRTADGAGTRASRLFDAVPAAQDDANGHGTHVGSVAAGRTVGVAKDAEVFDLRVLDANGQGSFAAVVNAIVVATEHAVARGRRGVINVSLTGYVAGVARAVTLAISYAHDLGMLVVTAAGNQGMDAAFRWPAQLQRGLVVGALQSDGAGGVSRVPNFNFGATLDLFAPGSRIYAAEGSGPSAYGLRTGTSMAAPFVAGAAALAMQRQGVSDGEAAGRTVVLASAAGVVADHAALDARWTDRALQVAALHGPGIATDVTAVDVSGGPATVQVSLSGARAAAVTVHVAVSDDLTLAASPSTLTFPAGNSTTQQKVTLTVDPRGLSAPVAFLDLRAASSDPTYDGAVRAVAVRAPASPIRGDEPEAPAVLPWSSVDSAAPLLTRFVLDEWQASSSATRTDALTTPDFAGDVRAAKDRDMACGATDMAGPDLWWAFNLENGCGGTDRCTLAVEFCTGGAQGTSVGAVLWDMAANVNVTACGLETRSQDPLATCAVASTISFEVVAGRWYAVQAAFEFTGLMQVSMTTSLSPSTANLRTMAVPPNSAPPWTDGAFSPARVATPGPTLPSGAVAWPASVAGAVRTFSAAVDVDLPGSALTSVQRAQALAATRGAVARAVGAQAADVSVAATAVTATRRLQAVRLSLTATVRTADASSSAAASRASAAAAALTGNAAAVASDIRGALANSGVAVTAVTVSGVSAPVAEAAPAQINDSPTAAPASPTSSPGQATGVTSGAQATNAPANTGGGAQPTSPAATQAPSDASNDGGGTTRAGTGGGGGGGADDSGGGILGLDGVILYAAAAGVGAVALVAVALVIVLSVRSARKRRAAGAAREQAAKVPKPDVGGSGGADVESVAVPTPVRPDQGPAAQYVDRTKTDLARFQSDLDSVVEALSAEQPPGDSATGLVMSPADTSPLTSPHTPGSSRPPLPPMPSDRLLRLASSQATDVPGDLPSHPLGWKSDSRRSLRPHGATPPPSRGVSFGAESARIAKTDSRGSLRPHGATPPPSRGVSFGAESSAGAVKTDSRRSLRPSLAPPSPSRGVSFGAESSAAGGGPNFVPPRDSRARSSAAESVAGGTGLQRHRSVSPRPAGGSPLTKHLSLASAVSPVATARHDAAVPGAQVDSRSPSPSTPPALVPLPIRRAATMAQSQAGRRRSPPGLGRQGSVSPSPPTTPPSGLDVRSAVALHDNPVYEPERQPGRAGSPETHRGGLQSGMMSLSLRQASAVHAEIQEVLEEMAAGGELDTVHE
ncbi:unnamed protein product [Pedinophyceae sp. YPF-701]|nr:unnamed protein product [Pedinophyceae sp. YPF-701]